jgi:hypothetical protein
MIKTSNFAFTVKAPFLITFTLLIFFTICSSLQAQDFDSSAETASDTKRQVGLGFAMAESGSSLGLFIAWPLVPDYHFGVGLDAFLLRDSKQLDYYDYYTGIPVSYNKQNNVYLFDLMVTAKRRFFKEALSDDFRPFLSAAVGPIYGMNFPEANITYSGIKKNDEFGWAFGGYFGCGIDFGVRSNNLVTVRAQYRIIPFAEKIGERSNHSMFELRFELAQRF